MCVGRGEGEGTVGEGVSRAVSPKILGNKWILQNQKSAGRLEPKHSSELAVNSTLVCLQLAFLS